MTDLREAASVVRQLDAALEGLPELEREAFRLWHLHGCSTAEIAVGLGANETDTKQAILRASEPEAVQ